jgi:hypothetical protein
MVWPAALKMRPLFAQLALVATLAACADGFSSASAPNPSALPARPHSTPVAADATTIAARAYYQRIEANNLAQGFLRLDGGGRDTPFDASDLADNFLRIALFDEYDSSGRLVTAGKASRLQRWQGPVRVLLEFGPSLSAAQRQADRALVASYLARMSRLTGLDISLASQNSNFSILVLNPPERAKATARILQLAPGTAPGVVRSAVAMAPDTYCLSFSNSPGNSAFFDRSIVVIRGELPPRMTLNCFHEELAQSLGLINDSPRARPSIFNDSDEFAALTRQDEMMLRILYDRRLRPGMTLAEARPIVETIAAELVPGDS